MDAHAIRSFSVDDGAMAVVVAIAFIFLVSLLKEPTRQRFMAIFVAGAGAAYLNGGLGLWEFLFTGVATYVAYRGLESYPLHRCRLDPAHDVGRGPSLLRPSDRLLRADLVGPVRDHGRADRRLVLRGCPECV